MGETERSDAWLKKEDAFVAKVVLDYIRTGKTQLEAFDVAGERIGRTQSAVAFRWNAALRNGYEKEINAAKKERLRLKRSQSSTPEVATVLSDIGTLEQRIRVLISRNRWMEKEIKRLRQENDEMTNQLKSLEDFAVILNDLNTGRQPKGERRHERPNP